MKDKNNVEYSEIDLTELSGKINDLFSGLIKKWNSFLFFLMKRAIILIPLFILGFILGFYLDSKPINFKHEVIVFPNFESVDYLNSKIELINSKINSRDTAFFDEIKINKKLKLSTVKVIPISDPFLMVEDKNEYLELIKLFIDVTDMDKLLSSELMTRKYINHKIEIVSTRKVKDGDKTVENIMNYLNKNDFLNAKKQQKIANIQNTIAEYDLMNVQANEILKSINNRNNENKKNDNISINNEYIAYNDVLRVKEQLIDNKNKMTLELVMYDKVIKDIQTTKNIINKKYFNGFSKFVLPLILIFIYFFFIRLVTSIKKYRVYKSEMN
uniref:hypothetical protein n=1 Tax=Flavobacterium sp. TaxID=239 RepID=UPI00404A60E7